jgi:hypothetical protein
VREDRALPIGAAAFAKRLSRNAGGAVAIDVSL